MNKILELDKKLLNSIRSTSRDIHGYIWVAYEGDSLPFLVQKNSIKKLINEYVKLGIVEHKSNSEETVLEILNPEFIKRNSYDLYRLHYLVQYMNTDRYSTEVKNVLKETLNGN